MQRWSRFSSLILVASLTTSGALAAPRASTAPQDSVVASEDLDLALAGRLESRVAARDQLREVLQQPRVKSLAEDMGLDLERVSAAVSLLDTADAARLAELAQGANTNLVGGQAMSGGTGSNFPILYVVLLLAIVAVFLLV